MKNSIKLEYYPKLDDTLLQDSIEIIQKNKDKWDIPFFFDTKSYLDIDYIKQASKSVLTDDIKNAGSLHNSMQLISP